MALRRLELTIVRRLDGFLHGEHLGLLPGPGTELAEARLYRPGEDDVRRMDWAVTARTTKPHVRDVISDRELETWALVDMSGSMDFGTAALEKRELAVAAVGTVGFLTHRLGDRFGGFVLRGGQIASLAGPVRTARAATACSVPARRTPDGARRDPATTSPTALDQLARANQRRGLRLVVSDFLEGSGADPRRPAAVGARDEAAVRSAPGPRRRGARPDASWSCRTSASCW